MTVPTSTYRIQFSPQFGFRELRAILPYLENIGISHIYASPIFAARHGSSHGYDVIDPNQVNSELGGSKDFEDLIADVRTRGMGWIQDIVPNHMAFDSQNRMLMDALEYGEYSPFFRFFDIDWNHPYENLSGKVLAPFLGKFYADCLESGELQLEYGEKGFAVTYFDLRLPLAISSYAALLAHGLGSLEHTPGSASPEYRNIAELIGGFRELAHLQDASEVRSRGEALKQSLWRSSTENAAVREYIQNLLQTYNGEREKPDSYTLLDSLLSQQRFRLSFWKVATEEINYRRFFNINQLICLRIEDEAVFQTTHALVFRLLWQNTIDGVRVDHIDGLYDPHNYLRRMRESAPGAFIVVEKILDPQEELPLWPIQGTTGYDFLNYVNGLLCERDNDKALEKTYFKFIGRILSYETLVAEKKRQFLGRHMAGDIDRLALMLRAVSARDRYARDITLYGLRRALVELLTFFPVYRTYVTATTFEDRDRRIIETAIRRASEATPALVLELQFIGRFLALQYSAHSTEEERHAWVDFLMRFQQLTGPLMAKGFEDTVLYIYAKLLSLNEVGGNARKMGASPVEFHHFNKQRSSLWTHSLNATATHDTKRGEDARARISALSEMPDEWRQHVQLWRRVNRKFKAGPRTAEIPDANDEYVLYQTLVGSFPLDFTPSVEFTDRITAYMIKAVREAKVHTAWLKPDDAYEDGFALFIRTILESNEDNPFLKDFIPFQRSVARIGALNSLFQVALKLTCPGIPDFYQGTELWDFSFVDPDNRRPVDFQEREKTLQRVRQEHGMKPPEAFFRELLRQYEDGAVKMYVTETLLRLRRELPELFALGDYTPLPTDGVHRSRLTAFIRRQDGNSVLVAVPRTVLRMTSSGEPPLGPEIWKDTNIELSPEFPSIWQNRFSDEQVELRGRITAGELLAHFPIAVLTSKEESH
jgi:(1->4)-alpha-D-glucan 1-alpha-D-glucosylmutase